MGVNSHLDARCKEEVGYVVFKRNESSMKTFHTWWYYDKVMIPYFQRMRKTRGLMIEENIPEPEAASVWSDSDMTNIGSITQVATMEKYIIVELIWWLVSKQAGAVKRVRLIDGQTSRHTRTSPVAKLAFFFLLSKQKPRTESAVVIESKPGDLIAAIATYNASNVRARSNSRTSWLCPTLLPKPTPRRLVTVATRRHPSSLVPLGNANEMLPIPIPTPSNWVNALPSEILPY